MNEREILLKIKALTESNADLIAENKNVAKMVDDIQSIAKQDDSAFYNRDSFQTLCKEATSGLQPQKVHQLSANAKHLYETLLVLSEMPGWEEYLNNIICSNQAAMGKNTSTMKELWERVDLTTVYS